MAAKVRESTVRKLFGIPDWYIFSELELRRLSNYVSSSRSLREVIMARYLDCEAFCEGENCFFCGEIAPVMPACCRNKVNMNRNL